MSTLDDIERKHKNYLNNEMAQMWKPQKKRVNIFVWWIADDKKNANKRRNRDSLIQNFHA